MQDVCYTSLSISTCVYVYVYIYIYIHTHVERGRERLRETCGFGVLFRDPVWSLRFAVEGLGFVDQDFRLLRFRDPGVGLCAGLPL